MTDRHRAKEKIPHAVPPVKPDRRYRPIADYAIVGDAQSAALVSSEGAINWLCLPHFDSPAVLCRILDADQGGFLSLRPTQPIRRSLRRYLEASNVLETTLETETASLRITDAMPLATEDAALLLDGVWGGEARHRVVRLLDAVAGELDIALAARLGFDFAATPAQIDLVPGKGAIASDGAGRFLALVWPGTLEDAGDGTLRGTVRLKSGAQTACVLAYTADRAAARALLDGEDWAAQVAETDAAWRRWSGCCRMGGPYGDALLRSVLTLKMLTFEPTGAVVAAPTTSLPEVIGGVRNWDYRYCWLRDATFTLFALIIAGDLTAAHAFWRWIERTCTEDAPENLQIMYGLRGERELTERTLDHLSGYRDSRPVRVGNGAWNQRQLDVYGELLDAFWFYYEHGGAHGVRPSISDALWKLLRGTADYICQIWREKDRGLWEVRGEPRHFVYSKVMCWVGLDRAVRLAETTGRPGDTPRWIAERDAIRAEILERGYSETAQAFTMAYETDDLDAAALRMPLVNFLPATDPRMRSTIEQIEARLGAGGLIKRYLVDDGLPDEEGAFSICTFWLVDCLTALGRIDDARELFEHMLGYANDLGLFAEEVDPATGAALGNYPQAFTHLALIDAGADLSAALAQAAPPVGEAADRAEAVRHGKSVVR